MDLTFNLSSVYLVVLSVFVVIVAALISASAYTVKSSTVAIIERFGKFHMIAEPGLHFMIPFMDRIAKTVDMRQRNSTIQVETRTKDSAFLEVFVAIQYIAINAMDAYYKLDNEVTQIETYVTDAIRSMVPSMSIDDTFENKNKIRDHVRTELEEEMKSFGYKIVSVLVTDIEPEANVKAAMNSIVAANRNKISAEAQGEANKIMVVKAAEAEKDAKVLQGEGIAGQRKAIVQGLEESVKSFGKATGVDSTEVMSLVLMTQYFDTLKEMGHRSNTIMMNHSPSGLGDIQSQIQASLLASKNTPKPPADIYHGSSGSHQRLDAIMGD